MVLLVQYQRNYAQKAAEVGMAVEKQRINLTISPIL
jgi:hypothetical protein